MNLSDLSDQTGPCHFDPGHTGPSYPISSQNGSCLVKGTNLNNSRSTVKDLQGKCFIPTLPIYHHHHRNVSRQAVLQKIWNVSWTRKLQDLIVVKLS